MQTVQTIGFVAAILGKTGTAADLQPDPEARFLFYQIACMPVELPCIAQDLVVDDKSRNGLFACRQKSILIVAPSSVVTNWQREFSTWGAFRVVIYHGSADSRAAAVQGIVQGTAEILLTTYDTFRCYLRLTASAQKLSFPWGSSIKCMLCAIQDQH